MLRGCLLRLQQHSPFLISSRHCSQAMRFNFLEDDDFNEIKEALIGTGHDLNAYQKSVMDSILNPDPQKPHHLIIQPTGSGKSVCFQLPILYRALKSEMYDPGNPTMGIVVTPTISLMEDQVQQLQHKSSISNKSMSILSVFHLRSSRSLVFGSIEFIEHSLSTTPSAVHSGCARTAVESELLSPLLIGMGERRGFECTAVAIH